MMVRSRLLAGLAIAAVALLGTALLTSRSGTTELYGYSGYP